MATQQTTTAGRLLVAPSIILLFLWMIVPLVMTLYFSTSNIEAAYNELKAKGVKVNEVKDDLYGPGSGVKWFNLEDPDGNRWLVVQS